MVRGIRADPSTARSLTLPVRLAAEGAEELIAAIDWYEEQEHGLGNALFDAVLESLGRIGEWPGLGQIAGRTTGGAVVRQTHVARFPYRVVYLELTDELRVLAFAHDRRRPGYWARRASSD